MSSKIPTRGPEPWPDQAVEVGQAHGDEVTAMFDAVESIDEETPDSAPDEAVGQAAAAEVPSLEDEFFDHNDPYANLTEEPTLSKSQGPPAWALKGRAWLRSAVDQIRAQLQGRTFDPVLLVAPAAAVVVGLLMGLAGQPWLVPAAVAGVSLGLLARVVGVPLLLVVASVLCIFAASWAVPGARPASGMSLVVLLVAVASGRVR